MKKYNSWDIALFDCTDIRFSNLHPLMDVMAERGLALSDVAAAAGVTRQMVYWWFRSNDIRLQRLDDVLGSLGVRVEYRFRERGAVSGGRRLEFVERELRARNMPMAALARACGVNDGTLRGWLRTDMCKMSQLQAMARALGLTVTYRKVAE